MGLSDLHVVAVPVLIAGAWFKLTLRRRAQPAPRRAAIRAVNPVVVAGQRRRPPARGGLRAGRPGKCRLPGSALRRQLIPQDRPFPANACRAVGPLATPAAAASARAWPWSPQVALAGPVFPCLSCLP